MKLSVQQINLLQYLLLFAAFQEQSDHMHLVQLQPYLLLFLTLQHGVHKLYTLYLLLSLSIYTALCMS